MNSIIKEESATKACLASDYYVDTDVSYLNKAIANKFLIKNTVGQMIKYGSKDLFRLQNSLLLESFDDSLHPQQKLMNQPCMQGNLKQKRLLKHYEKVKQMVERIDYRKQMNPEEENCD